MAVLCTTYGLNAKDKEEDGVEEIAIQWTWDGGDLPEREM